MPPSKLATGPGSATIRNSADATDRAEGTNLVQTITLLAVIGILVLQRTGSIPLASVGGMVATILGSWAALQITNRCPAAAPACQCSMRPAASDGQVASAAIASDANFPR